MATLDRSLARAVDLSRTVSHLRREGLARIAMLISRAGGGKHRLSQMQRVRELTAAESDTGSMSEDERRRLLHEETIVVEFEPLRARQSLPKLLRTPADRRVAANMLDSLAAHFTLDDRQRDLLVELRHLLPAARAGRSTARRPRAAPMPGQRAATTRATARA